ncbi:MAG: hypothetical protein R6X15_06400 [Pseudomonadota bacterium]
MTCNKAVSLNGNAFTNLTGVIAITMLLVVTTGQATADGLVIRGGTCSAAAFTKGAASVQPVKGDNYLTGLSVNCTTDTANKNNFRDYLDGIGMYNTYCVTTINSLERANVKIQRAPVKGNDYHCLLDGKAKAIAGKLTRFP